MEREKRHFLFLQGVISPFFSRLGDRLRQEGHKVSRINFCAGDALIWKGDLAWNFRNAAEVFPDFFESVLREETFTDLALFGNQRPLHRPAISLAKPRGMAVHVFEEGYIRPNWITLERDGVNGESRLPRDPAWYLEVNAKLPDCGEGRAVWASLTVRACHDMAYHVANLANPLLYPGYRTHRPYTAGWEYAGWIRRFGMMPLRRQQDIRAFKALADRQTPFYLFPLQLSADSQITCHSPFNDMGGALELVMRSFAAHAPKEASIVVKNHPLDTGLFDYRRVIQNLERELDIQGRVIFVETGDLAALLDRAIGVVIVNSTVGLSALHRGRPTKNLGWAIYDLPGLTFRGSLDEFWQNPRLPDMELVTAFRNVVVHTTQVNGDFYSRGGIEMAVEGSRGLLTAPCRLDRWLN